jgi:hypothetical protein
MARVPRAFPAAGQAMAACGQFGNAVEDLPTAATRGNRVQALLPKSLQPSGRQETERARKKPCKSMICRAS